MISDIKPEITFTKSSLSEKGLKKIRNPSRSLFKKDTFVVGSVGASIGKIGWLMKDFYCTTAVINFSADDLVTTKLLYYFMMTKKEYLKKIANGFARKNLYVKQIEEIKINLPNLEEQKRIIDIIEPLEIVIGEVKRKNNWLLTIKDQIINYFFIEKEKNSSFQLKNTCKIKKGRHYPSTNNSIFWDGPYPWLTISDIKPEIYDTKRTLSQKGLETLRNYSSHIFKKDSFVVACDGTIGKIGWLMKDFYSSTSLINIDSGNKITNRYLYYYFSNLERKNQLKNISIGSVVKHIYVKQIEAMKLNLYNFKKQKSVVEVMNKIENLIKKNIKINLQCEKIKKHLISIFITKK